MKLEHICFLKTSLILAIFSTNELTVSLSVFSRRSIGLMMNGSGANPILKCCPELIKKGVHCVVSEAWCLWQIRLMVTKKPNRFGGNSHMFGDIAREKNSLFPFDHQFLGGKL